MTKSDESRSWNTYFTNCGSMTNIKSQKQTTAAKMDVCVFWVRANGQELRRALPVELGKQGHLNKSLY